MSTYRGVNARLAFCLNSVLNVKAVVAAFNQEKALVGAFSVIVQLVRFIALVYIIKSELSRKATKVRDRLRLYKTASLHPLNSNCNGVIINFCASPSSNAAAAAVPGVVSG